MLGFRSGCSRRTALFLVVGLLTAALSACSGGGNGASSTTTSPPSPTLSSINITPGTPSVAAGLTEQFKATGTYSDGSNSDLTNTASWTSGSTGVATISASGLATSKAQGTATITAASGSVSGSATLMVTAPALMSITVAPVTVQLGSTMQTKATGVYTDQSTRDLTDTAGWSASNGYVASVNASGVVTSVGAGNTAVTAAQGNVQGWAPVTVLASPRYLYVAGLNGRTLTRLAVDGTSGQPRFAGYSQAVPNNIGFSCLTIDPSATHVYLSAQVLAGSSYAGTVAIFSIDAPTGTLTPLPGSPFSVPFALGCLSFAPSGKFAYASNGIEEAPNALATFRVNADATLTLNSTIGFPYSPTGLALDPMGQFLYLSTQDIPSGTAGASSLYGYTIDPTTGALTALNGSPWSMPAGTAGHLAMHPSGNFLYASDGNAYNILEYAVDRGTGVPMSSGTISSTCINPSALQFLPDGSHGYVLCGESGGRSVSGAPVVEFSVGSNGQLTAQGAAGAGPDALQMQVDEAGKFLYVLGTGLDNAPAAGTSQYVPGNRIMEFQVQADGSLKLAREVSGHVLSASMALLSGPAPVTWTTKNAFVTTSGDNAVTPYRVDADGTLAAGTSITTASAPFSASTLSWGSDLLFATQAAAPNNMYGYAVSGNSILNGTSFGWAAVEGGIVIDPRGTWAYATDPANGVVDLFFQGIPGYWFPVYSSTTSTTPYTFTAGAGAGPITMDPSGRYVVTANQREKSLSLIEPLGAAPTPNTTLTFTPLTVTVDATGDLLFVSGDDGKLHMFWNNGQGTLTDESDGTLLSMNTVSVAVDPTSQFVYAAGPAGLNAFSIDMNAGTLTPISLNLGVSLQNATGVYIEPAGKYLYVSVSSGTTNALYLFTINSDGTLTASTANPIATPNHATSMVFQATVQ